MAKSSKTTIASHRKNYDLASEIRSEIERIEQQIAEQRHAAVNRMVDNLSCEAAEAELRMLETRLSTLHGNLREAMGKSRYGATDQMVD